MGNLVRSETDVYIRIGYKIAGSVPFRSVQQCMRIGHLGVQIDNVRSADEFHQARRDKSSGCGVSSGISGFASQVTVYSSTVAEMICIGEK